MALMGVVAAAGGKSEALNAADVNRGAIADFLKGYKIPGDNSTYLSEQFILQQGTKRQCLHQLRELAAEPERQRQAAREAAPDLPLRRREHRRLPVHAAQRKPRRADYLKVAEYLKGDAAQTWLARQTLRRPIKPDVAARVEDLLPKSGLQIELPFSPDRALADGLIAAYLNEFRTPIASTFVLDTSGSMQGGGRRQQLVQAMNYIAGADASLTGRIAKLTNREKVWLQPFSDMPYQRTGFVVPGSAATAKGVLEQADSDAKQKVLADVRDFAEGLQMKGGTALYDAVYDSLKHMLPNARRTRSTSIRWWPSPTARSTRVATSSSSSRTTRPCPRT
jgi:Ca-activated chloride channel family protein